MVKRVEEVERVKTLVKLQMMDEPVNLSEIGIPSTHDERSASSKKKTLLVARIERE